MKMNDIVIGRVYAMLVSGKIAPVRIDGQCGQLAHGTRAAVYGGNGPRLMTKFYGVNVKTGRSINHISPARVRFEIVESVATTGRNIWVRAPLGGLGSPPR